MGFAKSEGEAHTEALKRGLVLKSMGAAEDPATLAFAAEAFEALKGSAKEEASAADADLKGLVYSLAAANGGSEAFETLLALYRDPATMSEEKVRILQSLGSAKDPALLRRTLEMVLDTEASGVRPQDSMYCVAGVALNLQHGRAFAWEWMKANWEALFEKYGTGGSFTLPRLVSYSTKFLVTEGDAADVEAFFADRKVEGAARTVAQSIEAIRVAAAMGARDAAAVKAWLIEQQATAE